MPRVKLQPETQGMLGRANKGSDRPLPVFGVESGIGLGVELHSVGADRRCFLKVPEIRTDEDRGTYAPLLELTEDLGEEGAVRSDIPACTAGQGVGGIGDEGHLIGTHTPHELHEGGDGVTLDIEFRRQHLLQVVDVLVAYVALVRSRVYRDTLGSEALAVERHSDKVGDIPASSIA